VGSYAVRNPTNPNGASLGNAPVSFNEIRGVWGTGIEVRSEWNDSLTGVACFTTQCSAVGVASTGVMNALLVTETLETLPMAPVIVAITPIRDGLIVRIEPPSSASTGGIPLKSYAYSLTDGHTWRMTGSTAPRIVIEHLLHNHRYRVVVRAVNALGSSLPSSSHLAVTR
jgi:hypothetical protein